MNDKLEAILKEYSTLRDEILLWTKTELTAITILFSLDTTLLGLIFYQKIYILFFLIPPINFLGVWLWLADHCMIRVLSAYISEKIERKKIVEVIGDMEGQLYIGWDTFVQNMPMQMRERGADRTRIILVLLWINTLLPLIFIYGYRYTDELKDGFNKVYPWFALLFLATAIWLTFRIYNLGKRKYSEMVKEYEFPNKDKNE